MLGYSTLQPPCLSLLPAIETSKGVVPLYHSPSATSSSFDGHLDPALPVRLAVVLSLLPMP